MPSPLLAVNIGNTNTGIGLVDTVTAASSNRISFPTEKLRVGLIPEIASAQSKAGRRFIRVAIGSVVKGAREEIEKPLSQRVGLDVRWLRYEKRLPVASVYADPDALGIDRLANALYCNKVFPGRSAVIVDAGTAIKVDLVEKGNYFAGGTIFPGIRAQLDALAESTSSLPRVDVDPRATRLPGTTTAECIQAGVLYGVSGGISRIVRDLARRSGLSALVVATGGAWPLLKDLIGMECMYVPDMTLVGLGLWADLTDPSRR